MQIYLARQPILDRQQNVYGYELLFRSGLQNFYDHTNGDSATSTVLSHSFFSIGIEEVTRGKMAFINFTRNLLLNEIVTLFPKEQMAVEIVDSNAPDKELVATCEKLKRLDYKLVLDDFVFKPQFEPLLDLVDIVKINFLTTHFEEKQEAVARLSTKNIDFLAKKVETQADFDLAVNLGYSYFQGYFFSKPAIITGRNIPAYKMNHLRILQSIHQPKLDYDRLERIFRQDVALSFKLLTYLNSAFFGLQAQIKSIRHALHMLGLQEAKKWLTLIAMSSMGKNKSEELVVSSLFRANLCEMLAPLVGIPEHAEELFLVGLFSMIDAFLDQPMPQVLKHLPLSDEVKYALLGEPGTYFDVLSLVIAYEKGDWNRVYDVLSCFQGVGSKLPELFIKTIEKCNLIHAV